MIKKKWLAVIVTLLLVFGTMAGVGANNDDNCPAAPAVAAELLREAGIEQLGPYVSQVSREMKKGAVFQGVDKCDVEAYREKIRDFLSELGVVFNPSRYRGMSLWLDGNSFIGEEEGTLVEQWTDISGNYNHATQNQESKRPEVAYPFLNADNEEDLGLPVVRFDDSNEQSFVFERAVLPVNGDFTFSVLLNVPAGVTADHDVILSQYPSSGISDGDMIFYSRTTLGNADQQVRLWIRGGVELVGSDIRGQGWVHLCITRSGDTWTLYENGVIADTSSVNVNIIQDEATLSAVASFDTRHFNGDIAEVLAYNRALSNTERIALENYLNTKHGL